MSMFIKTFNNLLVTRPYNRFAALAALRRTNPTDFGSVNACSVLNESVLQKH